MKLSNLHIERQGGACYLKCDVETTYKTKSNQIWISLPFAYANILADDVYDAFLVAFLYPAMYYNEKEIVIEGNISPRLYFHITNYLQHIIKAYNPTCSFVRISPKGFAVAKQSAKHVGTGFTGGVDAFTTVIDRYEKETNGERRIDLLFFNNFSSHAVASGYTFNDEKAIATKYYETLKTYPESIGIPYIQVFSNIFDFWEDRWEYTLRSLANAFMVLSIQKGIRYYYLSGEFSYREHILNSLDSSKLNLEEITELFLFQHLSNENVEIIQHGSQYTRFEKVAKVAEYKPAHKYLNVCIRPQLIEDEWDVHNCGRCHKCIRTLMTLDVLGILDDFRDVFDVDSYRRRRKTIWCQRVLGIGDKKIFIDDIISSAKQLGYKHIPTKFYASCYMCLKMIYNSCLSAYRKIISK